MAIDWEGVRYRGDRLDVDELFETYRIGDYLDAFDENRRRLDQGLRERLMKDGIRLSERLSPRIYRVYREVCQALQFETSVEAFCLPSAEVNAFAMLDGRDGLPLIGVTSAALERLEDPELRSILGHEIGHVLFGNNRLNGLVSTDQNNPSLTVLPAFGESLFLRWRKKAEISADRVGLLAAGDFRASAVSLLKATFGLSERNLNLDIEALLSQIDEIKDRPELIAEAFASHPLLPIRLKALDLFARSDKARRHGFQVQGDPLGDDPLEAAVDDLVRLTRRRPTRPLDIAIMQVVSAAGASLLAADGDISDDEVKILVQILHRWFTDEPEGEIVTDAAVIKGRLDAALEVVNREGEPTHKQFILSRLAEVALADGALMDAESGAILELALAMGLSPKMAYGVMVGAAQAVGFKTDVKLNRMAEDLRRSLLRGRPNGSQQG